MANQTVSVNRNLDDAAISGLLNGDSITINTGAVLTCDSDNRWSQQAAVVGSVTIDSTSGGKMVVDGRNVWQVPFASATGNVPTLGTAGIYDATGGTSGCQGEFLGVWATGEMGPRAGGGAMPASGYVKFRRKSTNFTSGETITLAGGATIVASDAGKRSWLHFVGAYQATVTVPRLGSFEAYGDWFDLGTTSGAADQEFDWPFLDVCDGIQIETAPGSGVYEWFANAGIRSVSGTATLGGTTDPRAKYFCQRAAPITATTVVGSAVITTTQTSELVVGMPINASASFANTALYIVAINPGVSFTVSSNANAAASTTFIPWRNKLKLAQSTGTVVGFLPAAGCKVRCPNVRLSTSLTPFAGLILPTAIGDRCEFATSSAGVVKMDTVDCGWYSNFSGAYSLDLRRVAQALTFAILNTATSNYIDNCVTSFESANGQTGLSISNCYGTTQILNSWISRYDATSSLNNAASLLDSANITISGCKFSLGGTTSTDNKRGNANINSLSITRCFDVSVASTQIMMGALTLSGSLRVTVTNLVSCDLEYGSTGSAFALTGAINVTSGSANVLIDGYSLLAGVTNIHPYLAVLNIGSNSADVEFRNAGTAAAPINAGSAAATGNIVTASSCLRIRLSRLYFDNIRTAPLYVANTCQGLVIDNVWGDGADVQTIAGLNLTARGCRWSSGITGQSSDYGRHWEDAFTSTTTGRVCLLMNEPTTETAAQVSIVSGTPKFTSTGNLAAPTVGDEVIFTMPYFAIGHTSLANIAPTVTGTNPANFTLTYQIDLGSGWNGTWLALTGANLSSHVIPPYVNLFNMGGFRLKIRAVINTANITNALTHIRIDTVTTATEQQRQYALRNPPVGYTSVVAGSILALYDDASSERAGVASVSAGTALATPPWNANYTVASRLRKPGYAPIEAATVVDVDGQTSVAAQEDWPTVPDTDPGALGITVTNHGASPVSWQGKDWSITITTTNDSLTAAQVAQFVSWNVSQDATFSGFNGLAWPYMVEPDGALFKTTRGRLIGSAGATLKGIRVVRSDGITIVPGFSSLMADDGTNYIAPTVNNWSVSNYTIGSRIQVYNVTTATEIYNDVPGEAPLTGIYTEETDFTKDDVVRVRVAYMSGVTANEEKEYTVVAGASGWAVVDGSTADAVYAAYGVDGSTCTEFDWDGANLQIDINDPNNKTEIQRIGAWYHYYITTAAGIANVFGGVRWDKINEVLIDAAIVDMKLANIAPTPLLLTGGRISRSDGASVIAATSGSIHIDYEPVYAIETGSAVLPSDIEDIADAVWAYVTRTLTSGGGGGGEADWTATERNQIRHRLGIDGTAAAPTATPSLALEASVQAVKAKTDNLPADPASNTQVNTRLAAASYTVPPTSAANASAVRTELTTELARIDVAISTRNATAPDNAGIAAIKAKTDNLPADPASNTQVNTRLAAASYVVPPTSVANASAVRTELTTELARIDVAVSTRNAITPDNAGIAAIKAKTDNLPASPAATSDVPTASQNAVAVHNELTELARLDVAVSTRLATAGYTAPDNAGIAAIKAKTDNLPASPAAMGDIPTPADNALAVRAELAVEMGRLDVSVGSRLAAASYVSPDNASIAAIKVSTDALPADPASEAAVLAAISAIPAPLDASATEAAVDAALTNYGATTPSDIPTPGNIADGVLARNLAGGLDGGRTVRDALRANRNRTRIDGTTMEVYQEDDVTLAWSAVLSLGTRNPINQVDPT